MNAALNQLPISLVASGMDVSPLIRQLDAHPDAWNRHKMRTNGYSPHNGISDIWVRYNDFANFSNQNDFNGKHESVWYPVAADLPAAWSISRRVMRMVGGRKLGGVLITRIPSGSEVKPHIDTGWHAQYYEKFAVQIKGNSDQAFCFEDGELSPNPGDLYTFDNSRLHWVTNQSDTDRITLIICIRRNPDDAA